MVGDHIETSVVLNFCEDLISAMNVSGHGKQNVRQIEGCLKTLKAGSNLMSNTVRSSFPWNGMYTPVTTLCINSKNSYKIFKNPHQ